MKSTASFNIKIERKIKVERLAMEVSLKIGRPVKWTEIMNVLVDQFSKDAVAYIENTEKLDKDIKLSDVVDDSDKISEKLSAEELKEIEKISDEILREEEKGLMAAQELENGEEKGNTQKLGRDENNILRHGQEEEHTPKIKELV